MSINPKPIKICLVALGEKVRLKQRHTGRAQTAEMNELGKDVIKNGTLILKFFLHLSMDEPKKRFLERLEDPEKHWKFSMSELAERAFWMLRSSVAP